MDQDSAGERVDDTDRFELAACDGQRAVEREEQVFGDRTSLAEQFRISERTLYRKLAG